MVRDLENLRNKVIPFFNRHPFICKKNDFAKFKVIVGMMDEKQHLAKGGLRKILKIAFSMNSGGRYRKLSLKKILSSL